MRGRLEQPCPNSRRTAILASWRTHQFQAPLCPSGMTAEGKLKPVWRESERIWRILSLVAYAWANVRGRSLARCHKTVDREPYELSTRLRASLPLSKERRHRK